MPLLAMVCAALLWSTAGLFIKIMSLDPVSLAGWRSAVAVVALMAFARQRGVRPGVPRDVQAWIAVFSYAGIMFLFVCATRLTTAANAIFLQYTAPIYVLMLEPLLLKTRFRIQDAGYVGLALAGMSLFFVGRLDAGDQLGNALALGSGICFALFALLLRAKHDDDAGRWQSIIYGNGLLALAVALYFALSPATATWPHTPLEAGALLFLGTVQIGVAYVLFTFAIGRLSALEATLIGMLEPVLNPVWVYLGTGERPSAWALIGATLIITAIATRTVRMQRADRLEPAGTGRSA